MPPGSPARQAVRMCYADAACAVYGVQRMVRPNIPPMQPALARPPVLVVRGRAAPGLANNYIGGLTNPGLLSRPGSSLRPA